MKGFLVFESGEVFVGKLLGSPGTAGELVFNTSHSGYEEIATDPSYFNQVLIATAPMQGNYGTCESFRESDRVWIKGFVCLEVQSSKRDSEWINNLKSHGVPILTEVDTRSVVLKLREFGTVWGAIVSAHDADEAKVLARKLIAERRQQAGRDWPHQVSTKVTYELSGQLKNGIRIALIDFGSKKNIIRELLKRVELVKVFPARAQLQDIKDWDPHGVLLSNGPGDPDEVEISVELIKKLIGWRPIFGICMGHQLLAKAMGAKTFKLKFGHRGGNHPILDKSLNKIYMTSQNHSYAIDHKNLPSDIEVTHVNLNDGTIAGIQSLERKCKSVQFHPESCPGPHESEILFDEFIKQVQ